MGLAPAIGAVRVGSEEGTRENAEYRILCASAATPESCTTHMGASPGMRRTCAEPARCSQGPHWEAHRPSSPHSSSALQSTYATLLGAPPYPLHTPSGAVPVAEQGRRPACPGQGLLLGTRQARRLPYFAVHGKHWFAPPAVHLAPIAPQRPLPSTLARRLALAALRDCVYLWSGLGFPHSAFCSLP